MHCDTIQPLLAADNEITRLGKSAKTSAPFKLENKLRFSCLSCCLSRGTRLASLVVLRTSKLNLSGVS